MNEAELKPIFRKILDSIMHITSGMMNQNIHNTNTLPELSE